MYIYIYIYIRNKEVLERVREKTFGNFRLIKEISTV